MPDQLGQFLNIAEIFYLLVAALLFFWADRKNILKPKFLARFTAILTLYLACFKLLKTFLFWKIRTQFPFAEESAFAPFIMISVVYLLLFLKKRPHFSLGATIVLILNLCNILYNNPIILFIEILFLNFVLIVFVLRLIPDKKHALYTIIYLYTIFSIGSWFLISHLEHVYQKYMLLHKRSELEVFGKRFFDFEKNGKILLRMIASLPMTAEAIARGGPKGKLTFSWLQKLTGAASIYFMDPSGTVTVTSEPRFYLKNYGFRPYFKKAMKGIANLYYARGYTTGKVGVFFARPWWEAGKIKGVLVIKYNFADMLGLEFELEDILFMHETGVVVTGPPEFVNGYFGKPDKRLNRIMDERILGIEMPHLLPYKILPGHRLQHKNGKLYKMIEIPLGKGEWKLAVLYDLYDIIHYRLLLLSIFTLLSLLFCVLALKSILNP